MTAVVLALGMVLADYILASRQGIPVDYYNHFSRPAVALYALAVIYSLHAWGGQGTAIIARISHLAGLTFTVYLIHPQILRIFNAYFAYWPSLAVWAATVVVSFGLVYVVKKSLEKIESPPVQFIQRALGLR